jgi:hypothetical protein
MLCHYEAVFSLAPRVDSRRGMGECFRAVSVSEAPSQDPLRDEQPHVGFQVESCSADADAAAEDTARTTSPHLQGISAGPLARDGNPLSTLLLSLGHINYLGTSCTSKPGTTGGAGFGFTDLTFFFLKRTRPSYPGALHRLASFAEVHSKNSSSL